MVDVVIGGIISHRNTSEIKQKGNCFGFKVTFGNYILARKYKDMLFWIIKNDDLDVGVQKGYYDKKEG